MNALRLHIKYRLGRRWRCCCRSHYRRTGEHVADCPKAP